MLPAFADYFQRLQSLHNDIEAALEGLPQDALDWVAGPDINSLTVLVIHLSGAERYWIGDVAGDLPSGRNRSDEFLVKGLDAEALISRLNSALEISRQVLEGLALDDLSAMRTAPANGRQYSVAWALSHALEHTAIHLGHIQIIRQLWDPQRQA